MAALTLLQGCGRRHIWLYDTFEGMPPPGAHDRNLRGENAEGLLAATPREVGAPGVWAWATLDDVRANLEGTGYPPEMIRYVAGRVEDTIPLHAPEHLALLRLDTDWYKSTRHELEHLWDRLVPGGVLLIDDYGHWEGARRAVDEFFAQRPVLLARTDYTGRLVLKPG
jgi:O-methyltransferase